MSGSEREEAPLFGRNPVLELLRARSRRVEEIAVLSEGRGPALQELLALAKGLGVKISFRTRDQLTAIAGTPHHQGVVARVAEAAYATLAETRARLVRVAAAPTMTVFAFVMLPSIRRWPPRWNESNN